MSLKKSLNLAIKKQTTKFMRDGTERKKIAKTVKNTMVKSLREGKGYDGKELPNISNDWSEQREDLIEFAGQKSHSKYGYGKSNITFSGELVRKLLVEFKSITTKSIKLDLFGSKDIHKPYKTIKGKKGKSSSTHAEIVEALEGRGWKILGIYPVAKKRITNQFKRFLRRNS